MESDLRVTDEISYNILKTIVFYIVQNIIKISNVMNLVTNLLKKLFSMLPKVIILLLMVFPIICQKLIALMKRSIGR